MRTVGVRIRIEARHRAQGGSRRRKVLSLSGVDPIAGCEHAPQGRCRQRPCRCRPGRAGQGNNPQSASTLVNVLVQIYDRTKKIGNGPENTGPGTPEVSSGPHRVRVRPGVFRLRAPAPRQRRIFGSPLPTSAGLVFALLALVPETEVSEPPHLSDQAQVQDAVRERDLSGLARADESGASCSQCRPRWRTSRRPSVLQPDRSLMVPTTQHWTRSRAYSGIKRLGPS